MMATTTSQTMSTMTKNNDKQPTITTINLWMTWVEETHVWLPRAMIFWFLSIEKRTNQISQSWERMLNDLYVSKGDSKPWSQSYVWLWLCSQSSFGLVLQTKVSSRQDRPEGVVDVKCVPSFFVSLSRWWIEFLVYIFKSNLYLAWLPTDYGVLTRLGEDEVAKPATTVHIVSEYIMEITFKSRINRDQGQQ